MVMNLIPYLILFILGWITIGLLSEYIPILIPTALIPLPFWFAMILLLTGSLGTFGNSTFGQVSTCIGGVVATGLMWLIVLKWRPIKESIRVFMRTRLNFYI
jgi:hypothetical protein